MDKYRKYSFMPFKVYRQLLMETKRYSTRQFNQATEMSKGVETGFIVAVIEKNKVA